MTLWALAQSILAASTLGQEKSPSKRTRSESKPRSFWDSWLRDPRNAVLLVLGSVILFGGGRKLLQAWRGRKAVVRLEDPEVTPETIRAVVEHGRAGLLELFRLLGEGTNESIRGAAGKALAVLWARDELIAEEEKALVRRGYHVDWHARRRYPRAIQADIPIEVAFGVPFLDSDGPGVRTSNLEWSYRIIGAKRVSLEVDSPWTAGAQIARFLIVPSDFESNGPHKLVFQARVRTTGLTEQWELELPHVSFSFEFDPRLEINALYALPDESRTQSLHRAIRLVAHARNGETARSELSFLPINAGLAIREIPSLEVLGPLPCDLAHNITLEFEGIEGRFSAGEIVLNSDGRSQNRLARHFPLASKDQTLDIGIERPGTRRLRASLSPNPDRGWADPNLRSLWPGTVETDWVEIEIVRR